MRVSKLLFIPLIVMSTLSADKLYLTDDQVIEGTFIEVYTQKYSGDVEIVFADNKGGYRVVNIDEVSKVEDDNGKIIWRSEKYLLHKFIDTTGYTVSALTAALIIHAIIAY